MLVLQIDSKAFLVLQIDSNVLLVLQIDFKALLVLQIVSKALLVQHIDSKALLVLQCHSRHSCLCCPTESKLSWCRIDLFQALPWCRIIYSKLFYCCMIESMALLVLYRQTPIFRHPFFRKQCFSLKYSLLSPPQNF